jgi:hypothetical protein
LWSAWGAGDGRVWGPATRPLSVAEVTDVIRNVVRQLAPEEIDVVDPVADAWSSGELDGLRRKRSPGAAVGSGVEAVLLTQLLFPIVADAVGDVLGTAALEPGRLKRRKSRSAADGAPGGGGVSATLKRDGVTLGLSETKILIGVGHNLIYIDQTTDLYGPLAPPDVTAIDDAITAVTGSLGAGVAR